MPTEREACNVLDGLFDTLATKFKPQYNETIKSLQFQKLHWVEGENVEEWMGRLCVATVECNYIELDRQLKEQFIHGRNDKCMLEEIIKELTATNTDGQITSEVMLAWAKRVEAQRTQAAVLNTIKGSRQFNKVQIVKKAKEDNTRHLPGASNTMALMHILWWGTHAKAVSGIWQDVARLDISRRYAEAEEIGLEMSWKLRRLKNTMKVRLKECEYQFSTFK